jgi:hypothetical protein
MISSCKVKEYPHMCRSGLFGDKTPIYYSDKYDNLIFPEKYQNGRQYSNGLAAVKLNDHWGFIDGVGNVVIPMEYTWVSSFGEYGLHENLAIAKTGKIDKWVMPAFVEGPSFLINDKGERVSPIYGDIMPSGFKLIMVNDGTGKFQLIGKHFAKSNGKWGFINKYGKEVIKCKYDIVYPFHDVVTFVQTNGKWGCINEKGKEIIPCQYDEVYYKSEKMEVNTPFDMSSSDNLSKIEVAEEKDVIYMVSDDNLYLYNIKGKLLSKKNK